MQQLGQRQQLRNVQLGECAPDQLSHTLGATEIHYETTSLWKLFECVANVLSTKQKNEVLDFT